MDGMDLTLFRHSKGVEMEWTEWIEWMKEWNLIRDDRSDDPGLTRPSRCVWNSLARLLLGAALEDISAGLFMRTLRRCFFDRCPTKLIKGSARDSFLLAPLTSQPDWLPGVQVKLNASSDSGTSHKSRKVPELAGSIRFTADWYLSALLPQRLTPLLLERVVTSLCAYFQQLSRLSESPS